jgi:hypothetical protein
MSIQNDKAGIVDLNGFLKQKVKIYRCRNQTSVNWEKRNWNNAWWWWEK